MNNPLSGAHIAQIAASEALKRRRAILDLYRSGMTYQAIAKQVGISRQRVAQLVKRANADLTELAG